MLYSELIMENWICEELSALIYFSNSAMTLCTSKPKIVYIVLNASMQFINH